MLYITIYAWLYSVIIVRGKHCVATATHTPLLIVICLFSDCHITL